MIFANYQKIVSIKIETNRIRIMAKDPYRTTVFDTAINIFVMFTYRIKMRRDSRVLPQMRDSKHDVPFVQNSFGKLNLYSECSVNFVYIGDFYYVIRNNPLYNASFQLFFNP